jgi:hypothetical protein
MLVNLFHLLLFCFALLALLVLLPVILTREFLLPPLGMILPVGAAACGQVEFED